MKLELGHHPFKECNRTAKEAKWQLQGSDVKNTEGAWAYLQTERKESMQRDYLQEDKGVIMGHTCYLGQEEIPRLEETGVLPHQGNKNRWAKMPTHFEIREREGGSSCAVTPSSPPWPSPGDLQSGGWERQGASFKEGKEAWKAKETGPWRPSDNCRRTLAGLDSMDSEWVGLLECSILCSEVSKHHPEEWSRYRPINMQHKSRAEILIKARLCCIF